MAAQPPNSAGCSPCSTETVTVAIPGPQGAAGADGSNGTDGAPGYTTTVDDFTVPADASSETINVLDGAFAPIYDGVNASVYLYIETAGYFLVTGVVEGIGYWEVTIYNQSFVENAAPGTLIAAGAKVGVAGPQGPVAATAFPGPAPQDATFILQTPDLDLASAQALSSLNTGFMKSTITTGVVSTVAAVPVADVSGNWPLANVSGQLAVANGGTGGATAAAARTNLGLGTISTQAASAVAITGGTISGVQMSVPFLEVDFAASAAFVSSTTGNTIPFDTAVFDPGADWNAGSFRYVPPENGYYLVSAVISTLDGTGSNVIAVRKNGTIVAQTPEASDSVVANSATATIEAIVQITVAGTDYIDLATVRSTGSAMVTIAAQSRAVIRKISS